MDFVNQLPAMGNRAYLEPHGMLLKFFDHISNHLTKRPLWIELGVSGTNIGVKISNDTQGNKVMLHWH